MKIFTIGLLVLVIALVGVGLVLPTEYQIEESIVIKAPAAEVHVLLDDLARWPEWAPWYDDDPSIVTTLGAQTTGVGATQSWTSDSGDGELTLTRSDPATGIAYDMAFIMEDTRAPAVCAMVLSPSGANGEQTQVTWTMEGDVGQFAPPVVSGYMTQLMKGQIGSMFQHGLEKLRALAEAG